MSAEAAAGRRGLARRVAGPSLIVAVLVALAPALLLSAAFAGVELGLFDWRGGMGRFALEWAPRLALVGVASGAVALVVSLLAGFGRYWRGALLALAITAATLAAYVWSVRPQPEAPAVSAGIQAQPGLI